MMDLDSDTDKKKKNLMKEEGTVVKGSACLTQHAVDLSFSCTSHFVF